MAERIYVSDILMAVCERAMLETDHDDELVFLGAMMKAILKHAPPKEHERLTPFEHALEDMREVRERREAEAIARGEDVCTGSDWNEQEQREADIRKDKLERERRYE